MYVQLTKDASQIHSPLRRTTCAWTSCDTGTRHCGNGSVCSHVTNNQIARSLWHRLCGNDGDVRTHHRGNGSECHQYLAVSHRTIHTGCGAPGIQLTHIGRQNMMGGPGS